MTTITPIPQAPDAAEAPVFAHGAVRDIPLDKLKKSPKNARKTPHTEAAIAALAASIATKGMLQKPVVEPEYDGEGEATGYFLVTIGEGRRLAQRLRAKRKQIKKTHPVSCVLDLTNDPHEISLDENVTRSAMHPADQYEAFVEMAERRGMGAEEIGARFGVSAHVVRQRLRLGAVSPKLMALYREDQLTLDQLMAFAVSEDHDRQEQVYDQYPYNREPGAIRRLMMLDKVSASDRRARFVGLEAYTEAGGDVLRDLFTEDRGGWISDVALLDRLAGEKADALAADIAKAEGWKWSEGHIDYPSGHGLARVYPHAVQRSDAEVAAMAALSSEYDALVEAWAEVEDLPADIADRFAEIEAALAAYGEAYAYDPSDLAHAGVFVVVSHDGTSRIERGLVRPEDVAPAPEPYADEARGEGTGGASGADPAPAEEPDEPEGLTALPDRMVADLTAHRTAALRDRIAENPDVAFLAALHALAMRCFYSGYVGVTCLDLRMGCADLSRDAEDIAASLAETRTSDRHALWARQVPEDARELWAFVVGLDGDSRQSLFAHCVGLSVNAVRGAERRPGAWAHADTLALALDLDMTAYWAPTARSYLGRVTKAHIRAAVEEGVGEEAAERIADLKKGPMVEEAERLLNGSGWLPAPLRAPPAPATPGEPREAGDGEGEGGEGCDAEPEAAAPEPARQVA